MSAEMIFSWDGQVVENVLHYEFDGAPITADMEELADFLIDWWDTNLKPGSPTTLILTRIRIVDLRTEFSPAVDYAVGLPSAGVGSGLSLPNNNSIVFTKRTIMRGRSFRGRLYHMGLTEAQVTNNAVASATVSGLITTYNLLKTFAGTTVNWTLGVLSRFADGNQRAEGLMTPVIGFTSDGVIDSQRRRLPGRGN
jgi:hypothetical protein